MKFVELFAGAGGLGRGLEAADMKHGVSFEIGDAAHDVLVHSGKLVHKTDLNDIASTAFLITGRPDIIVGGPPCQDFSKAGDRQEKANARLTPIFAMTVSVLRPEWFLFENVDRAPYYRSYHHARATWKRAGYGLTEVYVDCSHYGVPQKRTRFLCIGRLGERDGFLESAIRDAASQKPMVVRDMLDPRRFPEDQALLDNGYFWARPWLGKSGEVGGRGVKSIDEACPTIIRTTHEPPPPAYTPHPDDPIPAQQAHILTLEQVARIQGFPTNFNFRRRSYAYARDGWSDHDVKQMIANAVPAPMAEAIGKVIVARHYQDESDIPKIQEGFAHFLTVPNPKTGRKGLKSKASIANVVSRVNRARRMLNGRTYASGAEELAALESTRYFSYLPAEAFHPGANVKDFKKGTLDVRSKSDLRSALKLYREFQDGLPHARFSAIAASADLRARTLFPRKKSMKLRKETKTNPTAKQEETKGRPGMLSALGRRGVDFALTSPMSQLEIDAYFIGVDAADLRPRDSEHSGNRRIDQDDYDSYYQEYLPSIDDAEDPA